MYYTLYIKKCNYKCNLVIISVVLLETKYVFFVCFAECANLRQKVKDAPWVAFGGKVVRQRAERGARNRRK